MGPSGGEVELAEACLASWTFLVMTREVQRAFKTTFQIPHHLHVSSLYCMMCVSVWTKKMSEHFVDTNGGQVHLLPEEMNNK